MSCDCYRMSCCCTETLVYSRVNVVVGETVQMMCNTSLSRRIMWTYDDDTDDGYVQYVYWDGVADRARLLTTSSAVGVHVILITNAQLKDSGLYDCYDDKGSRQVGYQLVVNSMFLFITKMYICLFRQIDHFVTPQRDGVQWARDGAAENAGMENAGLENVGPNRIGGNRRTGRPKFQGWKRQDWKTREHHVYG